MSNKNIGGRIRIPDFRSYVNTPKMVIQLSKQPASTLYLWYISNYQSNEITRDQT